MHKKVALALAKALRSGNYVQGEGQLRFTPFEAGQDKYCCLGVLCELAIEDGVHISRRTKADQAGIAHIYGSSNNYPPEHVLDWAGIRINSEIVHSRNISLRGINLPKYYENANGAVVCGRFDSPVSLNRESRFQGLTLARLNDEGFSFDQIADIIMYFWGYGEDEQTVINK